MKIKVLSDIHLEFGPMEFLPAGEDLLVLAGDIGVHTDGLKAAKQIARSYDIPVLVIAGNHEFYRNRTHSDHTWEGTLEDLKREADHTDAIEKGAATFFENSTAVYRGVRFIGATLWTDMKLFGDNPLVPMQLMNTMNDYECIVNEFGNRILPRDVLSRHFESRHYIEDRLHDSHDGPTVVVTHHAPSFLSIAEMYRHTMMSAGFASRMEDLILDTGPTLWCHGHTHFSFDYTLGSTRIICNPRGYVGHEMNPNFNPALVIEINEPNDQNKTSSSTVSGEVASSADIDPCGGNARADSAKD